MRRLRSREEEGEVTTGPQPAGCPRGTWRRSSLHGQRSDAEVLGLGLWDAEDDSRPHTEKERQRDRDTERQTDRDVEAQAMVWFCGPSWGAQSAFLLKVQAVFPQRPCWAPSSHPHAPSLSTLSPTGVPLGVRPKPGWAPGRSQPCRRPSHGRPACPSASSAPCFETLFQDHLPRAH